MSRKQLFDKVGSSFSIILEVASPLDYNSLFRAAFLSSTLKSLVLGRVTKHSLLSLRESNPWYESQVMEVPSEKRRVREELLGEEGDLESSLLGAKPFSDSDGVLERRVLSYALQVERRVREQKSTRKEGLKVR